MMCGMLEKVNNQKLKNKKSRADGNAKLDIVLTSQMLILRKVCLFLCFVLEATRSPPARNVEPQRVVSGGRVTVSIYEAADAGA